jgi:hypothetical protein
MMDRYPEYLILPEPAAFICHGQGKIPGAVREDPSGG